jgi:hypothetical protein
MPTTLISSDSGVYPFDGPVDFARHNKGVRAHFFTRSDKVVDEKGQPILDACGNPSEHEIELVTISIAGDLNTEYTGLAHDGTEMSPHLRFADEYQRWKAGDESTSGTKLEAWDGSNLSARMIRDMADLHIKSG